MLINNAGLFLESAVPDTRLEDWDELMRVNLTAPFLLCRAILPLMQARGTGHIINVSSTSGLKGHLHQAAYCASKHGLVGLSRGLALEAKPHGVHVNVISPGGVDTDFIAGSLVAARIKGQAVLDPGNIADVIAFILRQPENVDFPEVTVQRFQRNG